MRFYYHLTCKKLYIMTKFEATQKIKKRLNFKTKEEVSIELGISRPTLDARLLYHTWKKSELTHIDKL